MSDDQIDQAVLITVLAVALLGGLAFIVRMVLEYA